MATNTHINSIFDNCSLQSENRISLDYNVWTTKTLRAIVRYKAEDFAEYYEGEYEFLHKFSFYEEESELLESNIEFIPEQKLISKNFEFKNYSKFNIKLSGFSEDTSRINITLYKRNTNSPDVTIIKETVVFSDELETFTLSGYAQAGLYYLYIRPEYDTSANNKVIASSFMLEDFSFESIEEEELEFRSINEYYMQESPNTNWGALKLPETYNMPTITQRELTDDEFTHPLNTRKVNEIIVPTKTGTSLDIPEGFTTYIFNQELDYQYVRFLAKRNGNTSKIRVTVSIIDYKWSVGRDDAKFKDILEITDLNELYIEHTVADETYTLYDNKWTEINIDFVKDFKVKGSTLPNREDCIYAVSIGSNEENYKQIKDNILINNFRIYSGDDKISEKFDPTFYASELGTFNNPFTEEHGRIFYNDEGDNYYFYFKSFNGMKPCIGHFLCLENRYYLISNTLTGSLFAKSEYTVNSKYDDKTYQIYFFENAEMARNRYFILKQEIVRADNSGYISYLEDFVKAIIPEYGHLDLFTGESFNFSARCIMSSVSTGKIIELEAYSTNNNILEISHIDNKGTESEIYFDTFSSGLCEIIIHYRNEDNFKTFTRTTIRVADDTAVSIMDIALLNDLNYIRVGETVRLDVMEPVLDPQDITYEWTSSNEDNAQVENGLVYGKSPGKAIITAYSKLLNKTASAEINVVDGELHAPKEIRFLDESEDGDGICKYVRPVGNVFNIRYRVSSTVGYNNYVDTSQKVTWSSNNKNIATVDDYGVVKCLNEGIVEIVCSTPNGINAVVSIKVAKDSLSIQDMVLDLTQTTLNLAIENDYKQLTATIYPEDTGQKSVYWTTSDPSIATVNQYGVVRPGYVTGTATITCTSTSNSAIFATCAVTVINEKGKPHLNILPDTVVLAKGINTKIIIDRTYSATIGVNVLKEEGEELSAFDYSVELYNDSIYLKISKTGRFTLKVRATIRILNSEKYVEDKCIVIVNEAPTSLTFYEELTLCNAFQDNNFIVKYVISHAGEGYEHYLKINDDNYLKVQPKILYDNVNDKYTCYVFNKFTFKATHNVKIKIEHNSDDPLDSELVESELSIKSPDGTINKTNLTTAKNQYDNAKDTMVDYLVFIAEDDRIYEKERQTHDVYHSIYTYAYKNLYDMLEKCIQLINNAIGEDQSEMSLIASEFVSNEVSTYSVGDYTNSNFENVTDMDYYQNECIKELIRRVLMLEEIIQELTNNNNNM